MTRKRFAGSNPAPPTYSAAGFDPGPVRRHVAFPEPGNSALVANPDPEPGTKDDAPGQQRAAENPAEDPGNDVCGLMGVTTDAHPDQYQDGAEEKSANESVHVS
jgi:hypothetical protein